MHKFIWNYLQLHIRKFIKDERGASAIEYGLIIGLIAVVLIAVLINLGTGLAGLFGAVDQSLPTPTTTP